MSKISKEDKKLWRSQRKALFQILGTIEYETPFRREMLDQELAEIIDLDLQKHLKSDKIN